MKKIGLFLTIIFSLFLFLNPAPVFAATTETPIYQTKLLHRPDGIGKIYRGREIAKVMGHEGYQWLERPERTTQENPLDAIAALDLKSTDTVADIGAGSGYFTFRIASQIPEGKVFAVDIQPQSLEVLNFVIQQENIDNIEPILSTAKNPNLPKNSVDLALMVDAYHEFEYPYEMMHNIMTALKPGGRVVLIEYRREDPFVPIKTLHKMTEKQVKKEMAVVGLKWQSTQEFLPQQHFFVFEKPQQDDVV
ncbi:MAG: class I SAM-dependent methyltransferase [Spirulinaceae cyanobacterium]